MKTQRARTSTYRATIGGVRRHDVYLRLLSMYGEEVARGRVAVSVDMDDREFLLYAKGPARLVVEEDCIITAVEAGLLQPGSGVLWAPMPADNLPLEAHTGNGVTVAEDGDCVLAVTHDYGSRRTGSPAETLWEVRDNMTSIEPH